MRKHISFPRSSMLTEYQTSFLHPSCYKSVTSTSTLQNRYHQLKGTSVDISTVQTVYVIQKWKLPPRVSKPSGTPGDHIRAPNTAVTNMDYTTVYRNDFRPWTAEKRSPFELKDNFKVNQGLTIGDDTFKGYPKCVAGNKKPVQEKQERKPFEGISSYRLDYVPHQVQPRLSNRKPACQTNSGLLAVSSGPKSTPPKNQELLKGASEFFDQFESWSLAAKLPSDPPADHKSQSTAHADVAAPTCQVTKSALLSIQTNENILDPLQVMIDMKECCKAWDGPQRFTRS